MGGMAVNTGGTPHRHGEPVFLSYVDTPLGPMVAGATEQGVCLLTFAENAPLDRRLSLLDRWFPGPRVFQPCSHLERLEEELTRYFAGKLREFTVPLVYPGTPFERRVWDALRTIPYGTVWSYRQVAEGIGQPTAVRAVGQANGRNRIAIVIPCHRVIRHGGELGGYGSGQHRKRYLLALEGAWPAAPSAPPTAHRRLRG